MRKIGAIFLCFVVIICVFRSTEFSFEEYLNYVEENAPNYKPQFFLNEPVPAGEKLYVAEGKHSQGGMRFEATQHISEVELVDGLRLRSYIEEYEVYGGGSVKYGGYYDVYQVRVIGEINPFVRYGELTYVLADEYDAGGVTIGVSEGMLHMFDVLNDWEVGVLNVFRSIYVFIRGLITVPVWLLHWVGVLSYGVFAS